MPLCEACKARVAAYNKARYQAAPKPWPSKALCKRCRKVVRPMQLKARRKWVEANRAKVNEAQRAYRQRVKRASRA